MSHKTVYIGIPANKLRGTLDHSTIASIVEEIMKAYVEDTAKEESMKCDWYEIGGRWAGAVGAVKGSVNVLPTENGLFAYELFDQYDAIVNSGKRGPYCVDDTEYIPVDGGLKKNIAWDAVSRLDEYKTYKLFELILNRDPRLGSGVYEGNKIIDGDLYLESAGLEKPVLKKGEAFYDWAKRLGREFGRAMMPPDAYIDTKGIWHDDNDAWAAFEARVMSGKFDDMPENLQEAAQAEYIKGFESFLDNELKDDDCFVILDCHCFP